MDEAPRRGWIRRCYDWVLQWAEHPAGPAMLFGLAWAEAIFFPVPPDVLLIALAFGAATRAWRFAAICTLGSVVGGVCGYALGAAAAPLGKSLLVGLAGLDAYYQVADIYSRNAFAALFVAGFTPVPYKVFAVSAGIFHQWVSLLDLVAASAISRGARFFLVAALIRRYGPAIKPFLERHLGTATLLVGVGVVGGFIVVAGGAGAGGGNVRLRGLVAEVRGGDAGMRAEALELLAKEGAPADGLDPSKPMSEQEAAYGRLKDWLRATAGPPPPTPDERGFRALNKAGSSGFLDSVAVALHGSWIGLLLSLAALAGCWFLGSAEVRRATLHVGLACVLALLCSGVLKPALQRERPVPAAGTAQLVEPHGPYSLPSNHAAVTAAAATALVLANPVAGAAGLVVMLVMGWSRVYLGLHYPGDVVAGWVVGLSCALLVAWWLRRRERAGHEPPGGEPGLEPIAARSGLEAPGSRPAD